MFDVIISGRLPEKRPLSRLLIDPEQTSARWNHVQPGGFGACEITFGQRDGQALFSQLSRMTDQFDGRAHLEIRAAGHTCYEGRILEAEWNGGRLASLIASGYGLVGLDDLEIHSVDATAMLRGELIRQMLATYTDGINAGSGEHWQEPGISHTMAEFDSMLVGDAITQLLKEGDQSGLRYDFGVDEGQTAFLRARIAPPVPDYLIDIVDDDRIAVDYRVIRNDVAVTYEDIADSTVKTTARVSDAASIKQYGRRDRTIQAGRMTTAGADVFRNTFLETHRIPAYSARITRQVGFDGRGLERPGGGEDPPWLVRSGRWVRVPNLDPDEPITLIITSVDYDSGSGVLDIQINNGIPAWEETFANVERVAAAVVYRIDPATGSRARS